MSTAAEQFLARFAVECQLEADLGALAAMVPAGGGGGLELVTVMAMLPTVMAQLQTTERRAELLHALGRAYNRAAEAA